MDQSKSGRISLTEQTASLGNSTGWAINGILGEFGNGVDGSLFAGDLAIYITTRSQKVTSRALQEVTNKLDV